MSKAPVVAISHGGGPMPLLGDPEHHALVTSMRFRVPQILRFDTPQAPKAIVLVTAHWSERKPTISNAEKHNLLFDYYGFPDAAYKLKYDAPGSPAVADEVAAAMREEGLEPDFDDERGWDHGVFVPMFLIRPKADIPIVQVSVLDSEDPTEHFAMGRALARLREKNIAIVGSGFASFHNFRLVFSGQADGPEFRKKNDDWSTAVTDAMKEADPETRKKMIASWRDWPNAYQMHPRGGAEHFLPLLVAAGAGGQGPAKYYADEFKGMDMYSYYWD